MLCLFFLKIFLSLKMPKFQNVRDYRKTNKKYVKQSIKQLRKARENEENLETKIL